MHTYKIIFFAVLILRFAYKLFLHLISDKQVKKPLPASVADIYDAEEYDRWKRYKNKQEGFAIVSGIATLLINIAVYCTDLISVIYYALPGGEIVKSLLFLLVMSGIETIISIPLNCNFAHIVPVSFFYLAHV